ncbi:hypothetical protein H6P81_019969 [Aristolochia fimbriata]|uniref:Uncharacterized protein n=1 Tax=Aristolochia fimbriata TaxID=158543 RepID=A0AAV7DTF5_ARIFI|nr:hypothetical protein H6P81_019969 [Aristolochia fimbriata]
MPGNEVADKVRNFFEQDNALQGQHQAQVPSGNWHVFNNPWVQRQNGASLSSATKSFNLQPSGDSERGNGWQSSGVPLGADVAHLPLRPDFVKSQTKNDQQSFNGYLRGSQGLPARPNQAEFQTEETIPERHNLTSRGLSILEIQQGNAPEQLLASSRSSERFDFAEAPVNFDFLGSRPQLMRSQQSGMPPHPSRQQSGMNDMQLWQQQLMYRQFQELQRQQQLQQLDQEARQQNAMTQLSAITRHSSGDQLTVFANGAANMQDSSNYTWPTEIVGGDPKLSNASQMFGAGMNWVQRSGSSPTVQGFPNGLMFPQDQSQALRSMGFVPQQQVDQSLYGAPVASARGVSLNHFPHIQGISQDGSDLLNRTGGSQVEKQIMHSAAFNSFESDSTTAFADQIRMQDGSLSSKQSLQGKNLFGQVPVEAFGNGVISGNFHQVNSLPRNSSTQELHGRQDHSGWAGNMEEKSAAQVGPSQGTVSLDPTEEKILFSSDDGIWGAFGRNNGGSTSGFLQGNQLEGNDYLNVFPSVQSGSWSALMQSAVAEASSSDTGVQDEWSGLSFQKTDLSPGNHPSTVDNNLQNSSSMTSKPFLSFEDSTASPDGFQQSSTKFAFEQSERVRTEISHESLQRSPQQGQWLDQNASQKPPDGSLQGQTTMHVGSVTEGAWPGQIFEQSSNAAPNSDMGLNLQNMRGSWAQQRNISSYSTGVSKPNGWNMNETLSLSGDSQSNDQKRPMHMERTHEGGMWRANTSNLGGTSFSNATARLEQKLVAGGTHGHGEDSFVNNLNALTGSGVSKVSQGMNQQILNSQQLDFEKRIVDSSLNYRGNDNLGKYQHQSKTPQVQDMSSGNSDRVSSEFDKKQDSCLQKEMSGDSYVSGRSHPGQQSVPGTALRENAWLNASDSRPSSSGNQKSSGQGLLQQGSHGVKGQEQGHLGQSKFSGQVVQNSGLDMEKRNTKTVDAVSKDVHSGYESRTSASFNSSASLYAPNRAVQTSQNMLELLHKVDQSRDKNAAHFGSSDVNASDRHGSVGSDVSASQIHANQSAVSQGFGLRLGPPSQRQPMASNQSVNEMNSRQMDLDTGEKGRAFSGSTPSQALPNFRDMPPQEHWEQSNHIRPNIPAQIDDEVLHSTVQGGSTSSPTSFPCHQPQQQVSSGAKQVGMDQSANVPFGNQTDFNLQCKLVSRFGGNYNSHDGASAVQSAQESLRGPAGGVSPLNLASKPYPTDIARSQHLNANTAFIRSSGQQESSVSQQGGAFSKMLHNVWTNVSSQQRLGPQHKVPPNLFQSMRPVSNNLEGTPWAAKEDDYNVKRGGNVSSEFGSSSIDSQQPPSGEEQQAGKVSTSQSEGADIAPQNAGGQQRPEFTGSPSSVVNLHQQEPSQTVSRPVTSTSNIDMEAFGRSLRPSNLPHQNYSLLHQMQAMREAEADPNRKGVKRLKVADSGLDTQPSVAKTGQRFIYGYGTSVKDAVDDDNSSDSKMLCFASEGKEDKSANNTSQLSVGGISMQNYASHLGIAPQGFRGSGIPTSVNPQMAPSWFEQYGTYKNGQILGMYDGLDSSRRNAKMAAQQFFFGKIPEGSHATSHSAVAEQANAGSSAVSASERLPSSLAPVVDQSLDILRPKKRKSSISELLPWHKEVTNSCQRLQTISEAELDWAQATNRRAEKLEDEAEMFEDGPYIPRPRRRLILITQLMQQLLCSLPASMLSADAKSEYETLTFFAARLAIGDACGLVSSLSSHSRINSNTESTTSGKQKELGSRGEHFFAKVVEDFIDRARKLENDLLRLDRRSSILDLRVECQDLERFSIINRFARYLGRGNADGVESASSSEAAVRRPLPQRYVTAIAMPTPRNLPEGVLCLSL